MSNNIQHPLFQVQYTEDGSPTLVAENCEPMHSLAGAASESLYIYSPPISFALEIKDAEPKILSIGLGLGYNEILVFILAEKHNVDSLHVSSFESEDWLRFSFTNWLKGKNTTSELSKTQNSLPMTPTVPSAVYDEILQVLCDKHLLDSLVIKDKMAQAFLNQKLQLFASLDHESLTNISPAHAILFDAYSKKTSPKLWSDEFLDALLTLACRPRCCLSTYAATGGLKRALKKHLFSITSKKGFANKRESTLALRENKL